MRPCQFARSRRAGRNPMRLRAPPSRAPAPPRFVCKRRITLRYVKCAYGAHAHIPCGLLHNAVLCDTVRFAWGMCARPRETHPCGLARSLRAKARGENQRGPELPAPQYRGLLRGSARGLLAQWRGEAWENVAARNYQAQAEALNPSRGGGRAPRSIVRRPCRFLPASLPDETVRKVEIDTRKRKLIIVNRAGAERSANVLPR